MLYVSSLTDVLSGYLDWHLARLKFMARFTTLLLTLTSSDLWKIAGALKAGVKRESNYESPTTGVFSVSCPTTTSISRC
jgi:hypothetical protein